jgi:hypothetical protein
MKTLNTVTSTVTSTFAAIGNFIQPAMLQTLCNQDGSLKDEIFLKGLNLTFNGKETNVADLLNQIPQEKRKWSRSVSHATTEVEEQQEQIATSVMPVANYALGTLQSAFISGKTLINTVMYLIASTMITDDPKSRFPLKTIIETAGVHHTNAEGLELIRRRLVSEELTIVDIAKLFKVSEDKLVMQKELTGKNKEEREFLQKIADIGEALTQELTRVAKSNGSKLQDEFGKLQSGKVPNWYDFNFLNGQPEGPVNLFKSAMRVFTEYLITAVTILKEFVNCLHSLYDNSKPLVPLSKDEMLDKLARETKGENALLWTKMSQLVKTEGPKR